MTTEKAASAGFCRQNHSDAAEIFACGLLYVTLVEEPEIYTRYYEPSGRCFTHFSRQAIANQRLPHAAATCKGVCPWMLRSSQAAAG